MTSQRWAWAHIDRDALRHNVQALAEKVTLKQKLQQNTLQIKKGEKLSIDFISEFLLSYDFEHVDFVFEPGQFSIRGGIIDIFSFANEFPYRIELFGNEVEAIKTFDPADQLSNAKFDFVTIIPNINSKIFTEEKEDREVIFIRRLIILHMELFHNPLLIKFCLNILF
jgi:transcription-repair coupling factor (superfamily II helicase)